MHGFATLSQSQFQADTYEVQAVEELNIKQKYWKDLLTDEGFTRKDIIHLQDPMNLAVSLCCPEYTTAMTTPSQHSMDMCIYTNWPISSL